MHACDAHVKKMSKRDASNVKADEMKITSVDFKVNNNLKKKTIRYFYIKSKVKVV